LRTDEREVVTPRLILRVPALADFDAYAAAWADPALARFVGGRPRSRGESWTRFTQAAGFWPLLGFGYWTVRDRATGAFVGTAGLADFARGIPQLEGTPEAGWAFVPSAWGKGYATETVRAILDWTTRALPGREVRCIVDPENAASMRVAEKAGFRSLGTIESELGTSVLFAWRSVVQRAGASESSK
jgi:RimJ/RimL family protein N-acetyltransferase